MRQYLLPTLTGLIILLVWQLATTFFHIASWILPSPQVIVSSFWLSRSLMVHHLVPTVAEAVIGLVSAASLGIITALMMEWSDFAKRIIYPFLILSQTIPFIVLAPLLTIWFGFGFFPKIIVVTIVCFFPVSINLFDGFSGVDSGVLKLMSSMAAKKTQVFHFVKWPSSLPAFFSGLKIAAAYSVLGAVISEWIGTDRGLGILLVRSAKSYLTDRVFATMALITILSIFAVLIVELIARLTIPWHYQKT